MQIQITNQNSIFVNSIHTIDEILPDGSILVEIEKENKKQMIIFSKGEYEVIKEEKKSKKCVRASLLLFAMVAIIPRLIICRPTWLA